MLQPAAKPNKFLNMASAKILLFTHKKLNDGTYPIVLQLIKDRRRKMLSLGHSSTVALWDNENNEPAKKHPNYKELQLLIQSKLYNANKIILELDEKGDPYTVDDIINKLKPKTSSITVFKYTQELIKKLEKTGKIGNSKIYDSTLNAFKKHRKDVDLLFNQFTYRIVKDFEEDLLEKKKKLNTISVYLRTLRAIYNQAIKDKIVQQSYYPFNGVRIKHETTLKRAISKDDIIKIRNLNLPSGSELEKARDYFLFSFNMRGMSFIDMAYLKICDLKDGRIEYSRKKTGQKFTIKIVLTPYKLDRFIKRV